MSWDPFFICNIDVSQNIRQKYPEKYWITLINSNEPTEKQKQKETT